MGNALSAKTLIEKACESGADAVKFQVYKTEKFYNKDLAPEAFELFKSFELNYEELHKLSKFARSLGLVFYATPFDGDSLDFLLEIGSPIIKVASSDITNEPFLHNIALKSLKIPFLTIISTGFARLEEIDRAVGIFRSRRLALLYCVSNYPVQASDVDLNFIHKLNSRYHVPAGFSDHSAGIDLSLGAAALGASMIERHFTTDRNIPGADHSMSLDPRMFKAMVNGIRDIEKAMGSGEKKITEFENRSKPFSMRSMYASRDIKAGETLTEDDILLLRPGEGVRYTDYRNLLKSKAVRDMRIYEKI